MVIKRTFRPVANFGHQPLVCFMEELKARKIAFEIFWFFTMAFFGGIFVHKVFETNFDSNLPMSKKSEKIKALLIFQPWHNSFFLSLVLTHYGRFLLWDLTKKGQWALHVYSIAIFVASQLKQLQMILNEFKWLHLIF